MPFEPVSTRDLISILIKHHGIHEGTFKLVVEFQVGQGAVGPDKDNPIPGLMLGVSRVGLLPAPSGEVGSVDASVENPLELSVPATQRNKKPKAAKQVE
jgi:hypothetical protein